MQSIGRNQPCPCGSGRKFKKCCGKKEAEGRPQERVSQAATAPSAPAEKAQAPNQEPDQVPTAATDRVQVLDGQAMDTIIDPLRATLDKLAAELGLVISLRRASYSEINAKIELEVATIRDDGLVMDKHAEEFLNRCRDFGFEQDDLGGVFRCGRERLRIVGLKPRARLPVLCETYGALGAPKRVRMSAEAVRTHLARGDGPEPRLRLLGPS